MAKTNKTLLVLAEKLGLSEEEQVIRKAEEFESLLQMKAAKNNITDTAKVVICLDLASSFFRKDLDPKAAIKCSGLKGPSYVNSKKIIENILELKNEKLTIPALCLTLQCSVQDLAENILEEYQKNSKIELDLNLPQYVCMAVHQACRISKIKVTKSKLIEKSQLKPSQWSKLEADWTKLVDEKFAAMQKKKGRSVEMVAVEDEEKMEVDTGTLEDPLEPEIEPYLEWRRRVLEAAFKELDNIYSERKLEVGVNREALSPTKRQSPRKVTVSSNKEIGSPYKRNESPTKGKGKISPTKLKSPSKFEPYNSPGKERCIRLVFKKSDLKQTLKTKLDCKTKLDFKN